MSESTSTSIVSPDCSSFSVRNTTNLPFSQSCVYCEISMDSSTASSPAALQRKRRRPAISCVQCRRRKVRCDRGIPCSQCAKAKNASCRYDPDDPPVRRPRVLPATTSSVTFPLSPAPSRGDYRTPNTTTTPSTNSSNTAPLLDTQPPWQPFEHQEEACSPRTGTALEDPTEGREKWQSVYSGDGPLMVSLPRDARYGLHRARGIMSKGRLYGKSHWGNAFEPFEKMSKIKQQLNFEEDSELAKLLKNCKSVARATKTSTPLPVPASTDFTSLVPPREIADELVEHYFRTFESFHRILHRQSFYRERADYWNNPATTNTPFVVKLLLVMSIGTCFHSDISIRSFATQWVNAAQSFVGGPYEKGRLNISGLQIHCLLIVARQTTNGTGGDLVWGSAGLLLRTAMTMGLHLDPKYFPKMSIFHSEMRKRLWATVLEINVQVSLGSGMPPLLSLDDFDCGPPSNINDEDIDELTKVAPIPKAEGVFTQTSIQIALLRSLKTRVSIASVVNNFRREPSYEEILNLSSDFTSQLRFQTALFRDPALPDRPTALQKNVLDLMTRRFLAALHVPFSFFADSDPRYYFSRKVALDYCMITTSYAGESEAESDDYNRLKLQAGGVFREVMIMCTTIIGFELHCRLLEDSGPSTHARISREPLHKLLTDMVDHTRHRIVAGETNVQGYFWFSMTKAQLDAIEAGKDTKKAIQETAKRVISEAYEILKERAALTPLAQTPAVDEMTSEDGFGWDSLMLDTTGFNIDLPDSWLFSGFDEDGGTI